MDEASFPPDPRWSELLDAARDAVAVWETTHRLREAVCAFNPPKPKRYTLGPWTYEETGEVRQVRLGEFYTAGCGVTIWSDGEPTKAKYPILRPVLEGDDA